MTNKPLNVKSGANNKKIDKKPQTAAQPVFVYRDFLAKHRETAQRINGKNKV